MVKVRFLETRTVQAANGETFEEGQVYDLRPSSARHWTSRGVAVEVRDEQPAPSPLPPAADTVPAAPETVPAADEPETAAEQGPRLMHAGRGMWHVVAADGTTRLTERALPRDEAEAALAEARAS